MEGLSLKEAKVKLAIGYKYVVRLTDSHGDSELLFFRTSKELDKALQVQYQSARVKFNRRLEDIIREEPHGNGPMFKA